MPLIPKAEQLSKREVYIGRSIVGCGVFANRIFQIGDRIGVVHGKIVRDIDSQSVTYLELGDDLTLEPNPPFRYLNHSCEPNCELVVEFYGSSRKRLVRPRMYVVATRRILRWEEIRNDYAWPSESKAIRCECGAATCRGWIVAINQVAAMHKLRKKESAPFSEEHELLMFPRKFSDLLNARGKRLLFASRESSKKTLRTSKERIANFSDLIDERTARNCGRLLDNYMYPTLKRSRTSIARWVMEEVEESYAEELPKSADFDTADLNGTKSKAVQISKRIGLWEMLHSDSFRLFAEAVSGYELDPELNCQIQCNSQGQFVGPHTDHFPELVSARRGYVDFHLMFSNEGVRHQWLVYEEKGLLNKVLDVNLTGGISVYHLPFWHYVTPLVAKTDMEDKARRWLVVGSFDIARGSPL